MDNVKRKCQVILLPSLEKTNLLLANGKTLIHHSFNNKFRYPDEDYYNLYIISDDAIKKYDFVYNPVYDTVYQWIINTDLKFDKINAKKIIATTNTSLRVYGEPVINGTATFKGLLPQPSPQFINKYCEDYNKGNQIIDVLVTYDNHLPDTDGDYGKPQVDKNNYITITKLKEYYTLKEISDAFKLEGIYYTENFLYKLLNQ